MDCAELQGGFCGGLVAAEPAFSQFLKRGILSLQGA